ncbi:MAG: DEAD/DEAH box helicase [Eubacteriales bacterium]
MKPENRSKTLLKITRSKAKMYEYNVPKEHHIEIKKDPAVLFTLAIGILGDITAHYSNGTYSQENRDELNKDILFSAQFFDSYFQTRLQSTLDPYVFLLGAASYYLSDLPGNSYLLAKQLDQQEFDLNCSGLDYFLYWLLTGNISIFKEHEKSKFSDVIENIAKYFNNFRINGKNVEELYELISILRNIAYNSGTPRELLFSDIICSIVREKIKNSVWSALPLYTDQPIDKWLTMIKKPGFISELWPSQRLLGDKDIYRGKSAIIQMPTSAGKTRATQIIIRSAFFAERTQFAVIVAPFRTLCHEIHNDLLRAFRGEQIIVDEMTDVLQNDFNMDQIDGQKQVLVVTPEKLLYVLRHNPELAEKIGLLIYDEGHQFDKGLRGITYELLLTTLKTMVSHDIQIVLLSAVITNGNDIGEWLIGDSFELISGTNLIPTYRTVAFTSWFDIRGQLVFVNPENPNNEEFYVPRVIEQQKLNLFERERTERYFPMRNDGNSVALYLGLKLIEKGSVAIFCGKKTSVSSRCEEIVKYYNRGLTLKKPVDYANKDEVQKIAYICKCNLGNKAAVTKSAHLGIFTHDRNTPQGIRLAVEYAMKKKLIGFVICTSTLAQGVNLPIRYLIVSSIFQTEEPMAIRDFHNLLGRTGRVDQHTEGSVIIADPRVYDTRNVFRENWRWRLYKNLLNPDNADPCSSSLLLILKPPIDAILLISAYIESSDDLNTLIQKVISLYIDKGYEREILEKQLNNKIDIISSIENYLMSNWDEAKLGLDYDDVVVLASDTLAYYLADEEQKAQLLEIFMMLENNIEKNITDLAKRKVFGRTMYGVRLSKRIEQWVTQNFNNIIEHIDSDDLIVVMWPILLESVQNHTFQNFNPTDILLNIAQGWIIGESYADLLTISIRSGAYITAKSQKRKIKTEHIIDICDNGFSYHGSLLVGAIAEIIELLYPEKSDEVIIKLLELQKRLKYGLPTPTCISLYEIGFADRVIAQDLCKLFNNITIDKNSIIKFMRENRERVREILKKYPSYFIERLDNIS